MRNLRKLISFLLCLLFLSCRADLRKYKTLASKQKIFLQPSKIAIQVDSLSSISDAGMLPGLREEDYILYSQKKQLLWFDTVWKQKFVSKGWDLATKEEADYQIEVVIVDMGEVRPRVFIEGLSVGLVLGFIAGGATGQQEVGLAVFLSEVLEEIVIVKVLKSFFAITSIHLVVKQKDGTVLTVEEFRSYASKDYLSTLSETEQDKQENRIRSNLFQNAKDAFQYLEKNTTLANTSQ